MFIGGVVCGNKEKPPPTIWLFKMADAVGSRDILPTVVKGLFSIFWVTKGPTLGGRSCIRIVAGQFLWVLCYVKKSIMTDKCRWGPRPMF